MSLTDRTSAKGTTTLITSFFQRLDSLEPVVRIILRGARLRAELTFHDGADHQTVVLDYLRAPARITLGRPRQPGMIRMKIDSDIMHQVLLGQLHPGQALGRREMLLRGKPTDLARFIPLLDFAPLLYREHVLAQSVAQPGQSPGAPARKEKDMTASGDHPRAVRLTMAGRSEQALLKLVQQLAYAAGYGMGALRRRFMRNLSLFDVLSAMARGIAAAQSQPGEDHTRAHDHAEG